MYFYYALMVFEVSLRGVHKCLLSFSLCCVCVCVMHSVQHTEFIHEYVCVAYLCVHYTPTAHRSCYPIADHIHDSPDAYAADDVVMCIWFCCSSRLYIYSISLPCVANVWQQFAIFKQCQLFAASGSLPVFPFSILVN